jgi:hypothetical protein
MIPATTREIVVHDNFGDVDLRQLFDNVAADKTCPADNEDAFVLEVHAELNTLSVLEELL